MVIAEQKRDLLGLWLSGLRLYESLELSWDDDGGTMHVVMGGKYPMLRIPAASEKGHKERLLPITPDFAAFPQETPNEDRSGFVFNFVASTGKRYRDRYSAGRAVSEIGKRAGAKVSTKTGTDGTEKVKFASAHDLRRSLHESMETTNKYYIGTNAEATASVLWGLAGNISGNSGQNSAANQRQQVDASS